MLDVGCGSGELLADAALLGAEVVGVDPAPDMVALASAHARVELADAEELPFDAGAFDVVTAINALQMADDTTAALVEAARVTRTGGRVGIAIWAEGARNDLDVLERAIATALDDEPLPDGSLRPAGGLEAALAEAGLEVQDAGVVAVPWTAADDEALVRGVLLGEDASTISEVREAVLAAAARFRLPGGDYVLQNAFRWAVART